MNLGYQRLTTSREDVDHDMYNLLEDNEENVVVQAKIKASTNSKGHSDTRVAIPCSNLHLQQIHKHFGDAEGGLDLVEPKGLIEELPWYIIVFLCNLDINNHLSL